MPKKKKPKNPDNLYQRNGHWWIRYSTGGKKIRRSLGTTSLREAKKLRDEILGRRTARARLGLPEESTATPVPLFSEVIEKWLNVREADETLALSTRRNSRSVVQRFLLPEFGNTLMSDITPERLELFIAKLRKRLKRSTVANYFGCLAAIIRQSIRRGWFAGPNPIDRLDRTPSPGPGRDTSLTEDEARALIAELSGLLLVKSSLALYTGLRWGEVHGLGWADLALDADRPTLTVRRSYRGKPKNQASAATVPISPQTTALMRRWRAEQPPTSPWVFPDEEGNLRRVCKYSDAILIHKAAVRAGIDKRITPHVFRHTFGTWVYERTGDPKLVQRLMRHASFMTSMKYVHDHRNLAEVVETLPDLTPRTALKAV